MADGMSPQLAPAPHFQEHGELIASELWRPGPARHGPDPQRLLAEVSDPATPLPTRIRAGAALALVGDPRVHAGAGPEVRRVPGGAVRIGLDDERVAEVAARWAHVGVEEDWIRKETPRHTVHLADSWIAVHPVTNLEYVAFLTDSGRAGRPSTWYLGAYPWDRANHPVAGVTHEDADAYVGWLSIRTDHPWRLPTEAEWEHAAAGPDGREFPWGEDFRSDAANTRETGVHTTTPIGVFPGGVSPYGLHDMGGNVEEFVADAYTPYPGGSVVEDHLVQSVGTYYVARGGSFSRFGDLTRTRRRHGAFPSPLYPAGFRLATGREPS